MQAVRTEAGVIPLHVHGAAPHRPVVLAICGAFAPFDQLAWLGEKLPEAEVVVAHLPGLLTDHLADVSLAGFTAAFLDLIQSFYANRHLIVVGLSIGGLVALSLNTATADSVIVVDPPLSTIKLWPLVDWATQARPSMTPSQQDWLWRIFGYGQVMQDRDYGGVLDDLQRPARVLIAGKPLGQRRKVAEMPGLLDAGDLARLRAHPLLSVRRVQDAGHDIANQRPEVLVSTIREALTL